MGKSVRQAVLLLAMALSSVAVAQATQATCESFLIQEGIAAEAASFDCQLPIDIECVGHLTETFIDIHQAVQDCKAPVDMDCVRSQEAGYTSAEHAVAACHH